ncbi:MAG: MFS family permease [Halioglobus sp.]|jgi:MFS family permease
MTSESSSEEGTSSASGIATEKNEPGSDRYKWYVVSLCTMAYVFSYVDRQILALMVGPVKADLNLTDTQFSLLHGLAFSLMYAFMGLPIARLADRHSRPTIIAAGIAFWSLATAACGISKNFVHMFIARMGVGLGEAALSPPAYSMFADMFPKALLGRVVGVYSIGAFVGAGMAFIVGGMVIELVAEMDDLSLPLLGVIRPWQLAFFIVGLPGLLIALLMVLTVKDPPRKDLLLESSGEVDRPSFGETLGFIRTHKETFFCHYMGFSCYAMAMLASLSWLPAFYTRRYGLDATETGYYLGAVVLLANTSGVYCSGYLNDLLHRRGHTDAPMYAGAIGASFVVIFGALFVLVDSLWLSLALLVPAMFFLSFPMPSSTTAMQYLAPNQMRAQASAMFILVMNLFALGLGTTLVALITDNVFQDENQVGYSLAIVICVAAFLAAVLLHLGRPYFRASLEKEAQHRNSKKTLRE